MLLLILRVAVLKDNAPHAEVSMLVGSRRTAGIPLAAGSHHKGFSDPLFLENKVKVKRKSHLHFEIAIT